LRDANFLAVSRAAPRRVTLRIGELATEALRKSFGVLALGDAKDIESGFVAAVEALETENGEWAAVTTFGLRRS
jgi:hypothetical protein